MAINTYLNPARHFLARDVACGEGSLQIVSPGVRVYVHDLAAEVEPFDQVLKMDKLLDMSTKMYGQVQLCVVL